MIFVSAAGSDAAAAAGCALVLNWLFHHHYAHTVSFCNALRLAAPQRLGGLIVQIFALHSHHGCGGALCSFFRERGGVAGEGAKKNSWDNTHRNLRTAILGSSCHTRSPQEFETVVVSSSFGSDYIVLITY